VASDAPEAFAVWITGLPASGKSTLTRALKACLAGRGIEVVVLESDELRKQLTPNPSYNEKEREDFYTQMVEMGASLVKQGVPVIFDATANRRVWREKARRMIPRFIEVYVDTPLEICVARDPKGIYRRGREGEASSVPGLLKPYEPPTDAEITVNGATGDLASAAERVMSMLGESSFGLAPHKA
jgi:adenylylsulfate kinase